MPGLESLQNAPVFQQQATGLSTAWAEALGLVLREVQAWAHTLAIEGMPVPQIGFELLDDKGLIAAESEMAWPEWRIAILLPETNAQAKFEAAGWTCFLAAEGPLPEDLINKLKETSA